MKNHPRHKKCKQCANTINLILLPDSKQKMQKQQDTFFSGFCSYFCEQQFNRLHPLV